MHIPIHRIVLLLFTATSLVWGSADTGKNGPWSLRIGLDLSLSRQLSWTDRAAGPGATPVYGYGYRSQGKRPSAVSAQLGLGYRVGTALELSLDLLSLAQTSFSGQVNYPDAGDRQPVSAPLRTTVLMASGYWRPLQKGRIVPFVSAGLGLARNHCSGMEMAFPQLQRPHTFALPRGTTTSLAWKLEGGGSLRLNPRLHWESGLMLLSAGRFVTEAGNGILLREGQTSVIPVQATQSSRPLLLLLRTGLTWRL